MVNYTYETHDMPNPLLPFIFHRDTVISETTSLPNWHENIEVLCCVGGEGWVKYDHGVTPFCCGDIVVVNTEMLHVIGSSTSVRYHCLIIDRKFWESNGIAVSALCFQTYVQSASLFTQFEQIVAAFDEPSSDSVFAVAEIRYAILGFMRTLCTHHLVSGEQLQQSVASMRAKQTMSYIRSHIDQSITLDDIAAYIGISKYHMSREFKISTGMTVIEAVNAVRCAQAKRLIEDGIRVSVAAQSCGFENMSYFSRTFKKQFGVLPSACHCRTKV